MKSTSLLLGLLAAVFLSGCSFNAGYNPAYLPAKPSVLGIKGKSLVVISDAEASAASSSKPTSFTGGGTTLTVPLGEISKQVALKVFGAAFADGVDFRSDVGDASAYRLVVKPRVKKFTYAYNQLKNLGFAITPQVEVELSVSLVTPGGASLLEKTYASGVVDGDTYALSGQPAEKVNQILHLTLFKLMTDAAMDAKAALKD